MLPPTLFNSGTRELSTDQLAMGKGLATLHRDQVAVDADARLEARHQVEVRTPLVLQIAKQRVDLGHVSVSLGHVSVSLGTRDPFGIVAVDQRFVPRDRPLGDQLAEGVVETAPYHPSVTAAGG